MPVRVWPGTPTGPSYNGKDGSLLKSRSGFEFQWAFHGVAVRSPIGRAMLLAGEGLLPVRLALFRRSGVDRPESNKLGNPPQPTTTTFRSNTRVGAIYGCTERAPCRPDLAKAEFCQGLWAASASMWRGVGTRRHCVRVPRVRAGR